jgi:hypothetical protein
MEFRPKRAEQNCVVEWTLTSNKEYADPFNDVGVSVDFTDPEGEEMIAPAFWAGGNKWCFRYSSHKVGKHEFRTICSDESNEDLHEARGSVVIEKYKGRNELLKHGPLRVSGNKRYLEHIDGKPFFWLGDTWWMGLSKRLKWPEGFKLLAKDRARKGFTVVQIVAGLYPDIAPFDPRSENEGGFPWEEKYTKINPRYFDFADRRISWLVQSSLVPCIVGAWGYYMGFAGEEVMRRHWEYIVARYYAYPVVWCIAGEATMPYYLSEDIIHFINPVVGDAKKREDYANRMRAAWTNIAKYVRSADPHHNPITLHPICGDGARDMVNDASLIDVDMLQTGHCDIFSFENTVKQVVRSTSREPRMPVLVGEVTYEGLFGANWENVQRLMFWSCVLNGVAGHTYGANGIWQVNTEKRPYGPSAHGRSCNNIPWNRAYKLPGSRQVGLGKSLLERYRWWMFEPHPEWVEPHWSEKGYCEPYAAGIPREVRVIYLPWHGLAFWDWVTWIKVKEIEPGVSYRAFYYDPRTGEELKIGKVTADDNQNWRPPFPPTMEDWVLVLEGH